MVPGLGNQLGLMSIWAPSGAPVWGQGCSRSPFSLPGFVRGGRRMPAAPCPASRCVTEQEAGLGCIWQVGVPSLLSHPLGNYWVKA